ncbi:unnamed protein product, partial [Adineta steineri]
DLYDVHHIKMVYRACVIKPTAPLNVDTLPATVQKVLNLCQITNMSTEDIAASATLTDHAAPDVQFDLINTIIDAIFQDKELPRTMILEAVFHEFPSETCGQTTASGRNQHGNVRNSFTGVVWNRPFPDGIVRSGIA